MDYTLLQYIIDYKQISITPIIRKMISNNNILPLHRDQIEVSLQGGLYKINKDDYNDRQTHLSLYLHYLVAAMLVANAYNVSLFLPHKLEYVVLYVAAVLLPMGYYIITRKENWPLLAIMYVLLVLNLTVDAFIPNRRVFIAGAIFSGVAFWVSVFMLGYKKFIVLVLLGAVQATLIQLKVSQLITEEWTVVLLPVTATEVCLFIALTILLILFALEHCTENQRRNHSPLWGFNVGIKIALISTHLVQLALPIAVIYSDSVLSHLGMVGIIMVHHLGVILFVVFKKEHIICSFALRTQEVSLLQQNNDGPSLMEKTIQRVSSHWFSLDQKGQKPTQSNGLNPQGPSLPSTEIAPKQEDCLICLTDKASMVWMPCGHLTTCETCASYLVTNGRLNCVLCKKQAKSLLKVDIQRPSSNQEYCIQREIAIVRGNIYR